MATADNYYLHTIIGNVSSTQQELTNDNLNQIHAQIGAQYWLSDADGALPDNLIATRTGQQLDIYLDNGVHLVFEDYYPVCANDPCAPLNGSPNLIGFDTYAGQQVVNEEILIVHTQGDLSQILMAHTEHYGVLAPIVALMLATADDTGNAVSQEPEPMEEDEEHSDSNLDWKSFLGFGLGAAALGLAVGSSSGGNDDDDDAPVFTSVTSVSVSEGQTAAYTAEATDADGDTLTYSLSGTDAGLFSIDANTGVVTFNSAPDFEAPGDADGNNVYEFTVTASDDDNNSTEQAITVTLTDVDEADLEVSVATLLDINVSLGPVLENNTELTVELYKADNDLLGESFTYDAESGSFVFEDHSNYSGIVQARLVDAGEGVDYLDEASLTARDVTVDLRAFAVIEDGQDSVALNINPLTTLAAEALEFGATAAEIQQADQDVAEAFGIDGTLQDHRPILTIDAEGNAQEEANAYGIALALISAYENASGQTTKEVIDEIVANLDGNELDSDFITQLIESAANDPDLQDAFLQQLDAMGFGSSDISISVDENLSTDSPAFTAALLGAAEDASYSLDGTDADLFSIDAATGVITFNSSPDYENPTDADNDNLYELTVIATVADATVEQQLSISVDDLSGTPLFAQEEVSIGFFEETAGALYTTAATGEDDDTLIYSLSGDDARSFSIDATSGEVFYRLADGMDYETPGDLDGNNVYELTVTATDADGNTATQQLSITLFDTLDLADVIADNDIGTVFVGIDYGTNENFATNGESSEFGESVSSIGDFNNDGNDDLLLATGFSRYSYVVYGGTDLDELDLSNLQPDEGLVIESHAAQHLREVSSGDINGDGISDLVISQAVDYNFGEFTGGVYVVFGSADYENSANPVSIMLTEIDADDADARGFSVYAEEAANIQDPFYTTNQLYLDFPLSASSGGDLNGDGIDDLVIAQPYFDSEWTVIGYNVDATDENNDRDELDTNGDGVISGADGTNEGAVYVIFGSTGLGANIAYSSLDDDSVDGFVIRGVDENDLIGSALVASGNDTLSNAGDINGDGVDDLILGVSRYDATDGDDNTGAAYLIFGTTGEASDIDLADIDNGTSNRGIAIYGVSEGDRAGSSVSSGGDLNGDGIDDLIIGAYGQDSYTGAAYVIFGSADIDSDNIELADIDAGSNQGFAIYGINEEDRTARSLSNAGDINGDGLDDLVIGAVGANSVFVVYGTTETSNIDLANPEDWDGFVITAGDEAEVGPYTLRLGYSVSSGGDINGDGFDDLIVGAPTLLDNDDDIEEYDSFSYIIYGGTDNTDAIVGGTGDNTLIGTGGADQIVGGAGNDTLVGDGGADVLRGATGDDVLAISDATFARLDGGNGTDTLRFDAAITLDFTTLGDNLVTDIEQIDLTDGDSTLTLNLTDVLNMTDSNNELTISGDSGDIVNLDDTSNGQSGGWEEDSNTYNFVTSDGTGSILASVIIDEDVTIAIV